MYTHKLKILYPEDSCYPKSLITSYKNPPVLRYIGEWDKTLFKSALAVVGSRKVSLYGNRVTTTFVEALASYGITIISGFMYGVDMIAHRAALAAGGRTVAVLGTGIEVTCSRAALCKTIVSQGGLIVSEYENSFKGTKWSFPKRNKLVMALSDALLVTEASSRSGTIITASIATKMSKDIYLIARNLDSEGYEGLKHLEGLGAKAVFSPSTVEKYLGINITKSENSVHNLSSQEKSLLTYISKGYKSLYELKICTGKTTASLLVILLTLESYKLIIHSGGKYYVK